MTDESFRYTNFISPPDVENSESPSPAFTNSPSTQPLSTLIQEQISSEQFEAEKQVLSCVKSPFIVELYGEAEDNHAKYLAIEYLSGGDMFDLIQNLRNQGLATMGGGLDLDIARFHAAEILLGLQQLHKNGFVWCDLKPENITFDGTKGHVKLIDFGSARKISSHQPTYSNDSSHSQNKTNKKLYTIEYMAPEQLEDESKDATMAPFDTRADLWSYGVLLFEMLTGRPPFQAPTQANLIQKIKNAEYDENRIFDAQARDLIKQLLTIDPRQRPSIEQIKKHPCFERISWIQVERKNIDPPIPLWAREFYSRENIR